MQDRTVLWQSVWVGYWLLSPQEKTQVAPGGTWDSWILSGGSTFEGFQKHKRLQFKMILKPKWNVSGWSVWIPFTWKMWISFWEALERYLEEEVIVSRSWNWGFKLKMCDCWLAKSSQIYSRLMYSPCPQWSTLLKHRELNLRLWDSLHPRVLISVKRNNIIYFIELF